MPGAGDAKAQQGQAREIKVRMPESVVGGAYANSMMVQHTREEFILDFALVVGGTGSVVARVVISPGHLKRVVQALSGNLATYERTHGQVEPSAEPQIRIGFQPPA